TASSAPYRNCEEKLMINRFDYIVVGAGSAGCVLTNRLSADPETSREIIDAGLRTGSAGYHAIGTAAMGPDDDDVVDSQLRVRGVSRLRAVDASVLPTMVSGNLNGPIMAMAWRAADLSLGGA